MKWIRVHYGDEDRWLFFEIADDGWANRQVELRAGDSLPVTAASLEEVLHLRDNADLPAMVRYERQYGVLAEGALDGWRGEPGAEEITAEEFERWWVAARRTLGRAGSG